MTTCTSCGTDAPEAAAFCPTCGRSLDRDATDPVPVPDATRVVVDGSAADATRVADADADATTVLPATDAGFLDRRRCGACGEPRRDDRVLCPVCGAAPDGTGVVPAPADVHLPGDDDRVVGTPRMPRTRSVGRGIALVAGVAAVGAVVGLAVAVAISRGGDAPAGPPTDGAVFDPAAHPDEPSLLAVTATGATATEAGSDSARLVDGDRERAWRSGPTGEDVRVALELGTDAWLTTVRLVSGDPAAAAASTPGRPVRVVLSTPSGAPVELALLDADGLQQVRLPEPIRTDRVELRVTEVAPGTVEGVALAEVELLGHVVLPADGTG